MQMTAHARRRPACRAGRRNRRLAIAALGALLGACEPDVSPPAPHIPEPFHLNAYEKTVGYSQAVKVGRTIYISATFPVDAEGKLVSADMAGQLDAVYANLAATLKAEGASFSQVVLERVYTTDLEGLLKVADRRFKYYSKGELPATSWAEVRRLYDPGFLVAIEAVAELP
jgi:2-iminobutanoate/2-iminopropanoate deaminase